MTVAAIHNLAILYLILAVAAFGLAIYCAFRGLIAAAIVLAVIGVLVVAVT